MAVLRRAVQLRDRRCIFRGCRAPAHGTDIDHTRDHAHGGPTLPWNLGSPCRHDHRLKHEGGWRLDQPEPGVFIWTSRLGQRYTVRPPPIIEPLPDPQPRDGPYHPIAAEPDHHWQHSAILDDEPEPAPAEPKPAPAHNPGTGPQPRHRPTPFLSDHPRGRGGHQPPRPRAAARIQRCFTSPNSHYMFPSAT